MILPSIVTRDCKHARHIVTASLRDRQNKRLFRRLNRRSLDRQVSQMARDVDLFDCLVLKVKRFTGWDIA